jgi:hypothetical protein
LLCGEQFAPNWCFASKTACRHLLRQEFCFSRINAPRAPQNFASAIDLLDNFLNRTRVRQTGAHEDCFDGAHSHQATSGAKGLQSADKPRSDGKFPWRRFLVKTDGPCFDASSQPSRLCKSTEKASANDGPCGCCARPKRRTQRGSTQAAGDAANAGCELDRTLGSAAETCAASRVCDRCEFLFPRAPVDNRVL